VVTDVKDESAKKLVFEVDLSVRTQDVAHGFPLREHMR
jgi:hypothetical protein